MQTAVVIVNYGTADLTAAAVDSVLRWHRGDPAVEIHVVDNASPGGDAAVLARHHATRDWGPQVVLHPETENHGFGRGNNVVLRQLGARDRPPEFVFLLNPDARLENDAIAILKSALLQDPSVGFAGARIRNVDMTPVSAAFRFPSCASVIVDAINFGPVSRLWHQHTVSLPPDTAAGSVDWVSGAAVMIRFAALKDIGFFDPDFFLYFEEVELMHRGKKNAWTTIYVTDAMVVHAEGAATKIKGEGEARPRKPAYWYRSWSLYFEKTNGRSGAIFAGLGWMIGAGINYVLSFIRRRRPHSPQNFYHDFWNIVFRPLLSRRTNDSDGHGA